MNPVAPVLPPVTPLPVGPALMLPMGILQVQDNGRLISNGSWIVAVGISPKVFLVAMHYRDDYQFIHPRLLHELIGYLVACGGKIFYIEDYRCPLIWRCKGSFTDIRRLWSRRFINDRMSMLVDPLASSAKPRKIGSLADMAEHCWIQWRTIDVVSEALLSEPPAEPWLWPKLAHLSRRWERQWNKILRTTAESLTGETGKQVNRCDEAWLAVVRKYLVPHSYQMQGETTARML